MSFLMSFFLAEFLFGGTIFFSLYISLLMAFVDPSSAKQMMV